MINKWILFVISSSFGMQVVAEDKEQNAQDVIQFEYLRAIRGACSAPSFDSGFLKYTYNGDCVGENKAELQKACSSNVGSHFDDLWSAVRHVTEG